VFRLIKLLVSLAGLVGFVWFGMTVELGERTLFQHVRAISESEESEELVRGTKETVTGLFQGEGEGAGKEASEAKKKGAAKEKPPVVFKEPPPERARAQGQRPAKPATTPAKADAPPPATKGALVTNTAPQESLTGADRQGMRKIISGRRPPGSSDRPATSGEGPAEKPKKQ
jgi:hypothetical protein